MNRDIKFMAVYLNHRDVKEHMKDTAIIIIYGNCIIIILREKA